MVLPRVRGGRLARHLAVPALAVAVVALIPLGSSGGSGTPASAGKWTPLSPVKVAFESSSGQRAKAHVLAFNDFHGNIDPPGGNGGLVNGTPAGGAEYLATWVKKLRDQAGKETHNITTVTAGDNIGASPLVSAAFHDEPAIEILNQIGVELSSVGNHEFDEGVTELKRLQNGGCHPTDGCQDGDGFKGARFSYLSTNVVNKSNGLPMLLPLSIKAYDGVPVAYLGMTLKDTPTIVNPAGIQTVNFLDEVKTANQYASLLSLLGIKSIVLVIHQGGSQQTTAPAVADPSSCDRFAGPITDIVKGLRPEFGLVVSGHTHRWYSCALPNSSGKNSVVTSAGTAGVLVTDISVSLDKRTHKFSEISARNVVVENGVKTAAGSWQRDSAGNYVRNPALVDPAVKKIADKYRTAVAPLSNRVVGRITADIGTSPAPSGESPLGDVIADGQLRYTQAPAGAQIALMNPGGIRTSLVYGNSAGGEAPGQVTYGECFAVQPFNNLVVTQTLTGQQIKDTLEQQWAGTAGQTVTKILQVSAGFTYTYKDSAPGGSRVSNLALNGTPVDLAATYRVTTNDFLANGGDGFSTLTGGKDRTTAPGFDIDALVSYLGTGPVAPGPADRITKIA